MYRYAMESLKKWKESKYRKPLIIEGARQVATISGFNIYYYTNDRGTCEVDFVVDNGEKVVPVEVKAEINLKAKSLKTYREKFNPQASIRTAMTDYKEERNLINLPLYAIGELGTML